MSTPSPEAANEPLHAAMTELGRRLDEILAFPAMAGLDHEAPAHSTMAWARLLGECLRLSLLWRLYQGGWHREAWDAWRAALGRLEAEAVDEDGALALIRGQVSAMEVKA